MYRLDVAGIWRIGECTVRVKDEISMRRGRYQLCGNACIDEVVGEHTGRIGTDTVATMATSSNVA